MSGGWPRPPRCRRSRARTLRTSSSRALPRNAHSASSPIVSIRAQRSSGTWRQRSLPQAAVQIASAAAESHEGTCTPLVTCSNGTSCSGQRGNSGWKMRRLTAPCSRLTPKQRSAPRQARYAMLNGSPSARSRGRAPATSPRSMPLRPGLAVAREQIGRKTVESGLDRRVGGEDVAGARRPERLAEAQPVPRARIAGPARARRKPRGPRSGGRPRSRDAAPRSGASRRRPARSPASAASRRRRHTACR